MASLKEIVRVNIFKSLYINIKNFGIKGILKMPIIIQFGAKFICPKGGVIITSPLAFNMLTIKRGNVITIYRSGKLIINGIHAVFNKANVVNVFPGAVFEIGDNFIANGYAEFNCKKGIKIGDGFLSSVHVIIMDTDFHPIFRNGEIINPEKVVTIGNNVWVGCNVTILKGVTIGNDIVIGAGSVLSGKYTQSNSVYAGNPSRLIKSDISWRGAK